MMKIFKKIEDGEFVGRFLKRDGRFIIDDPLTFSLVVASVFRRKPQKILINCPNLYEAQEIYEHLIHFSGEENLLFFPQDEIYRIDIRAYSKEMLAQRLFVMNESLKKEPKILICHSASLSRFLPESSLFRRNTFELYPGKAIGIDEIAETLSGNGYQRVNKIDGALQYAKRGDILDIYPIHLNKPVRIEFLYDEIESIRSFDIAHAIVGWCGRARRHSPCQRSHSLARRAKEDTAGFERRSRKISEGTESGGLSKPEIHRRKGFGFF